jgi:hypothetical protein
MAMSKMPAKRPIGRPTKMTQKVVATIAQAISFGLTDEEAASLVKVSDLTMTKWRKIPEFVRAIKTETSQRLLFRMQRIERGEEGWQGTAWCLERMYPARFAKPEIQLSISNNYTQNNLSISVTVSEAKEIEAFAEPVRQSVKDMFASYKPQQIGNGAAK